ncbi:MAG: hypothetical protein RIG63_29405 [Coleofasciculus chthonoplastes F3-SA18-01]|uniref:hypothetical protein n=1 Tax=Coleofasciculus chthonoplastes TaxID=64178 RepID=UPI0032FA450B
MIISDLEHLQVVSESREVEGGNRASARAFADSLARGSFDYYYYYYGEGASASTLTETNTFTDYSTAAASSASNSSASTYSGYYY